MKNRITSAETAAQQSDTAEETMSSQPCSNTFVIGSQGRVSSLSKMKKIWLSDEYLKKRSQSYEAMRQMICQETYINKFNEFLKKKTDRC